MKRRFIILLALTIFLLIFLNGCYKAIQINQNKNTAVVVDKCLTDLDCNDGNITTRDTCSETPKICLHETITSCINNDNYCPSGCSNSNDNDCTIQAVCTVPSCSPASDAGFNAVYCLDGQWVNCPYDKGICSNGKCMGTHCSTPSCNPSNNLQYCSEGEWVNCTSNKECSYGQCAVPTGDISLVGPINIVDSYTGKPNPRCIFIFSATFTVINTFDKTINPEFGDYIDGNLQDIFPSGTYFNNKSIPPGTNTISLLVGPGDFNNKSLTIKVNEYKEISETNYNNNGVTENLGTVCIP